VRVRVCVCVYGCVSVCVRALEVGGEGGATSRAESKDDGASSEPAGGADMGDGGAGGLEGEKGGVVG